MVERPNVYEFLAEVLAEVEDLPEGFAERLQSLVADKPAPAPRSQGDRAQPAEDRAEAIRRLIEEHCGG